MLTAGRDWLIGTARSRFQLARASRDQGASLIIALIVITVVAMVTVAVLTLASANFRATVALQSTTSTTYNADGAADVAINQIRQGTFPGSNCLSAQTLPLPSIDSTDSGPASAAVRCTPGSGNESNGGGANSSPGSALLTLGTEGINLNSSNNDSVKVQGGVFSNSTINLASNKSNIQDTATDSYIYSMGACTGSGSLLPAGLAVCNYSSNPQSAVDRRGMDPGTVPGHGTSFDPPTEGPFTPGTWKSGNIANATCSQSQGNKASVYEFQPGVYTNATALSNLTDGSDKCSGSVWHFNPGTYYFNFSASDPIWTIGTGYLVGGTSTGGGALTVAKVQQQQAAGSPFCIAPQVGGTNMGQGVKFVFGGASRMFVTGTGNSAYALVQICASNAASGPPVAIYGLKTSITSGATTIPAESGCVTSEPYVVSSSDSPTNTNPCAVIRTQSDPNPGITVFGTTYVPRAVIDLTLNNNSVQVFRWGLVARGVFIGSTGSTGSLANAVISVPNDAPAPFPTPSLYYLDVYVCPGSGSCTTSGAPYLKAAIQVSGSTPRTVSVISWSTQR